MGEPSKAGEASIPGRVVAVLTLLCVLAGVVALWVQDPRGLPSWLGCPTYTGLGLYCAGCGSTRAAHDLLHGDIVSAWRHNPLALLLGLPAVAWVVAVSALTLFGRPLRAGGLGPLAVRAVWVLVAAVIVFSVLRNLPGFDALRPPRAVSDSG